MEDLLTTVADTLSKSRSSEFHRVFLVRHLRKFHNHLPLAKIHWVFKPHQLNSFLSQYLHQIHSKTVHSAQRYKKEIFIFPPFTETVFLQLILVYLELLNLLFY